LQQNEKEKSRLPRKTLQINGLIKIGVKDGIPVATSLILPETAAFKGVFAISKALVHI